MNESGNPYQPPSQPVDDVDNLQAEIIPARKWLRFANLLIDYIGHTAFGFVVGILIALIWGDAGIVFLQGVPDFLIGLPIVLAYYITLETLFGRTLGKFVTGTRVVNEEGKAPSFGQVLGRSFSRFIPFEAFTFLGESGRGWHDSFAGTYVIKYR